MAKNNSIPMVIKKENAFLLIFISCCLFSCSTNIYHLSILQPGKFTFPQEIKRLTLYSTPCIKDPRGYYDSIILFNFSKFENDPDIKQSFITGLYSIFLPSPRFVSVKLSDLALDTLIH